MDNALGLPSARAEATHRSWFLFGIEVIGHLIEEPFGLSVGPRPELLPLRRYSDNIILDLKEENRIITRALQTPSENE